MMMGRWILRCCCILYTSWASLAINAVFPVPVYIDKTDGSHTLESTENKWATPEIYKTDGSRTPENKNREQVSYSRDRQDRWITYTWKHREQVSYSYALIISKIAYSRDNRTLYIIHKHPSLRLLGIVFNTAFLYDHTRFSDSTQFDPTKRQRLLWALFRTPIGTHQVPLLFLHS